MLQIEELQFFEALQIETQTAEVVVSQIQLPQIGKVAENVFVFETLDFVLFQMQFIQFRQIAIDENVVQIIRQSCIRVVSKSVGQVKFLQVYEVRENPRMMVVPIVTGHSQIIMIQYQSFHVRDVMVCFPFDIPNLVIAHIYHSEHAELLEFPKNIPRQFWDVIPGENDHLRFFREILQHIGAIEVHVSAIDEKLLLMFEVVLPTEATFKQSTSA